MDWLGTVRGRAGYGDNDGFLYLTGGLAYGRVTGSYLYSYDPDENVIQNGVPYNTARSSGWETGWVAGGGFERRLNRDWSLRAEYLHVDLGDQHLQAEPVGAAELRTEDVSFSSQLNLVRIGASYHFH
jgi:outer membrane immunogenic protein